MLPTAKNTESLFTGILDSHPDAEEWVRTEGSFSHEIPPDVMISDEYPIQLEPILKTDSDASRLFLDEPAQEPRKFKPEVKSKTKIKTKRDPTKPATAEQATPTKLDVERGIHFHEPHPMGKTPFETVRRHGRRLTRAYGWHGDDSQPKNHQHERAYLATLTTHNENGNSYYEMEQAKCLYMMKETADGHGLFAKELIKAGTRIIHEKPILTVSQDETKTKAEYRCVIDQVANLSDPEKQRLMNLYHNDKKLREFSFLQGQPCPGTDLDAGIVLAKFYTNAASITSGGLECGLFTIFCRMNHSCTPNICWVYDEPTGFMEVYAVRDIDKDEEITNSYIEVAISHQARMKELSNWGFTCQCTACEGPDAAKHDERRRRIAQIKGILDIYQDAGKSGDAPKFAEIPKTDLEALRLGEESLALLLEEGLIEQLGVMYGLCGNFAKGAGLHDSAEDYEEMEFEILVITTGEYID
ncbi:hypothetical protein FPRO04_11501 [Fusarium proliferatum]|nr:hypothetical protein FPRO04_11501 [Fusarium proliferatum]